MKKIYFYGSVIIASIVHYPLSAMEKNRMMLTAIPKAELQAIVQTSDELPTPVMRAAVSSSKQSSGRTTQANDSDRRAGGHLEPAALASQATLPGARIEKSTRLLDKSAIRVENNTNDWLLIRFQKKLTRLCECTLMPRQFIDFSPVQELTLLQVEPYGKCKGLVPAEILCLQLPNLTDFVKLEAERLGTPRVKLSVLPYWDASQSERLAYPLALAGETLYYTHICDYTEQLDEYTSLEEAFPQLAHAVKNKNKIFAVESNILDEARSALNLPFQGGNVNAYRMYHHLSSQWNEISARQDNEAKRFAKDAKAIIEAAHLAFEARTSLEAFVQLVRNHFMQEKQTYNVRADARALLEEFLEERGKEVSQAEQCDQAIQALKKLMVTWPRFDAFMKTRPANEAVIHRLAEKYFPASAPISKEIRVAFLLGTTEARDWLLYYKASQKDMDSFC